mmetsp:Transcript_58906/g.80415  ORF Transcript_58906/g.80415 Transcript_58906/m.80415 type:complete len:393 (-) Transcript_58906:472-1650(-)
MSQVAESKAGDVELANFAPHPETPPPKENHETSESSSQGSGPVWLAICFFGIMGSLICYGMVLEYATSGGRKLHELSLILVTSSIYAVVGLTFCHVQEEKETTVPTYKLAVLAVTSMGSTFTSVCSLRYVIFPVQVLAKSCKPIPVMIMGACMGKTYPLKKYLNVAVIVLSVAMFMGMGDKNSGGGDDDKSGPMMYFGIALLFLSLCFDGGTGAYEDKLMSVEHVGPFTLMYNIQKGKAILAFMILVIFNEVQYFFQMVSETGPILALLGLTGAFGQIFIFVTIAKFGALTCALIGIARKITTLIVSILFFGHKLNWAQTVGLAISIGAMIFNFVDKTSKKKKPPATPLPEVAENPDETKEQKPLLEDDEDLPESEQDAFPDANAKDDVEQR